MLRPLSLAILIAATLVAPLARAGNDDSCDIGVAPAATLLLPYFEVDFQSPAGKARTTLFTATNLSPLPQIAHVTVSPAWACAALTCTLFLTPYDPQLSDPSD